jgi:hypothetical protein
MSASTSGREKRKSGKDKSLEEEILFLKRSGRKAP